MHSFKGLLSELATRARSTTRIANTEVTFTGVVKATPIVVTALNLVQDLSVAA